MNILQISTYFSMLGGLEVIAYNTYRMLKEAGYKSYFFASDYMPYIEDNYEYKQYFTKYMGGVKNYLRNPLQYYYNIQAKKDLQRFIGLIKPDIIHVHSLDFITSSILDCCKNIPTVFTIHGANLFCPAGTMIFAGSSLCKNLYCRSRNFLPCIINKCARNSLEASIRRSILLSINSYKFRNVQKFITPSDILKKYVIESNIGINGNDIIKINNFLPNNEINKKPNYKNQGYFLYVGRLSQEKGVHYLLEAMKDIPQNIELHIIGTGTGEQRLKNYTKENSLNNVKFLGFKNREEVQKEYHNCIATILPCNWFEIFGLTNVESFINGKPVIASNIGAIPEIVDNNVNGLLFEPANVEELKNCILKYWNNPRLVIEHGKNAYEKARTQYTEEKYYNELMQVYNEVLKNAT